MDRKVERRAGRSAALLGTLILSTAAVNIVGSPSARATGAARDTASRGVGIRSGTPQGVLPPRSTALAGGGSSSYQVGLLTYHGGPVMHDPTVYAVYWQPAGTYMSPKL